MFVYSQARSERVLDLAADGLTRSEIARLADVSVTTVRRWLRDGPPEGKYRRAPAPDLPSLPPREYAYLLGIYLGDGHVAPAGCSFELRIACDQAYPAIVDEVSRAITAVNGGRSVRRRRLPKCRCVLVRASWPHWPLVLPQAERGRKHERPIVLQDWQTKITQSFPDALVRGLIHSDGSRFIARQPRRGKVYEYVRYTFSNRSEDIKSILCEHLDLMGVQWTVASSKNIQVARRESVALLDRYIGPKA